MPNNNNKEELVQQFREAFENLPKDLQRKEVDRLYTITHNKRIIVLEDPELGKVIKFLDMKNLVEYLYKYKKVHADRSFLYKVLKGQYGSAYGMNIYYED